MAEETQATQAAETQPDPQPQPAAQPEAGAQAAPADPEPKPRIRMTLSDGRQVYWQDGEMLPLDEDGNRMSTDPRQAEQPAEPAAGEQPVEPEEQADGTPEASSADDEIAKLKEQAEIANRRVAMAEYLASQPGQTYVPGKLEKLPELKFKPPDLSDRPRPDNFQTTDEWQKADEAWMNQKLDAMSRARAAEIAIASRDQQAKEAEQAHAQRQFEADLAARKRLVNEARRRTGLSEAEFETKHVEVRRAAFPAWYAGENENELPINVAAEELNKNVNANASMGLSNDGYDGPVELLTEALKDTAWVAQFSNAFPKRDESLQVIRALAEGPNFIHRARQLTTTEEGKKALAWMLSLPSEGLPKEHPMWPKFSEHVRLAASRFDKPTSVPAATPAATPTNTPAATPAPTPTNAPAPAAVTPEMRGSAPAPSTDVPNIVDDPNGWARHTMAKMREEAKAKRGYVPHYLN